MLDKEPEELQYLGAWGILRDAFNVLRSSLEQFVAVTLTLILPLSFVILGHTLVSDPLLKKIQTNEDKFEKQMDGPDADRTLNALSSEWTRLLLFQAGYFVFLFAFSLLSTAAVVYTVACIYTGKQTTYTKVMSVVPKVWKRLMLTFMWYFLIMVGYNTAVIVALVAVILVVGTDNSVAFGACIVVLAAVFLVVHVYISSLWHLGSVISVLEDKYGAVAIQKSRDLIKGKRLIAFVMVFVYFAACTGINGLFGSRVVHGSSAPYDAQNETSFEGTQSDANHIPASLNPTVEQRESHTELLLSESQVPQQKQQPPVQQGHQQLDLEPKIHQQQLEHEHRENQQHTQYHSQNGGSSRGYQGQRGGRGTGYRGGRGRAYMNGRGGRFGRDGGYSNGPGQYYEPGNYYRRNYNNGRGRGRKGAEMMYNIHASGPSQDTVAAQTN